jgi:fumarate hydratase, class II
MALEFRIEKDTLGEVKVPKNKCWGAQTERSRNNFSIGMEKMPLEVIKALALIKKSAAIVNHRLGKLDQDKKEAITFAAEEIITGKLDEHFPLSVWQTGSGTQTNMNVNEVIAFRGNQILHKKKIKCVLHPNDDVNKSQSSNDTFPSAMHIAARLEIEQRLFPAIQEMKTVLVDKQHQYQQVIKIGRTHLQDATPLTFGQEISGWVHMLEKSEKMIRESSQYLKEIAIGGTAVGTGITAHPKFGDMVAEEISNETRQYFVSAPNKFHALTSHDELVYVHGALKALAADLMKIANDVRWLASGPRCGIGEIKIPANEPGSSIMPGKVNPTQSEALTMIACQVFGNDTAVGVAASQGNFQLNVFKPVIIYNVLQSIQLLADGMASFTRNCLAGLEANEERMSEFVQQSLMLVTILSPHIGYEKAAHVAKKAYKENMSLREAAIKSGWMTEEEYDEIVIPNKMIKPSE